MFCLFAVIVLVLGVVLGVCVCVVVVVVVVVLHDKRPFKVYHLADLLVFLKDRHVLHYYRSTYTLRTVRS